MNKFAKAITAIMLIVAAIIVSGCSKDSYQGHEYVDLGLPSGTLWATCNVGADTPEGFGDYFAWGETEPKSVYSLETYKHKDSIPYSDHTGAEYLRADDDAASANWGGNWRTPTYDEWNELCQNTTFEITTLNGVKGLCFKGSNSNVLFLPYAGYNVGDDLNDVGISGRYWKSTVWGGAESQMFLNIHDCFSMGEESFGPAYQGCSVRSVCSVN